MFSSVFPCAKDFSFYPILASVIEVLKLGAKLQDTDLCNTQKVALMTVSN